MRRFGIDTIRRQAPYATLLLAVIALFAVPTMNGAELRDTNFFNIGQSFATYGVLALGLGLVMLAGEFDLSVPATFAVGSMVAVKTGQDAPALGALVAIGTGAVIGLIQGGAIAGLGVPSMSITVGGYIALTGLVLTLGDEASVGYTNYSVGEFLDQRILTVLSVRSLLVIAAFGLAAAMVRGTRLGRDMRAIGGDRRAARVAGVRVATILVGLFAVTSAAVALAGASVGYALGSASPELGSTGTLVYATTATLLGGVALSGGVGTVPGIAAGALTLATTDEMLNVIAAPSFVSDLVTGGLLVFALTLAAPDVLRRRRAATIRSPIEKEGPNPQT